MFRCVNCGHEGMVFHVSVTGSDQGALTYQAACPECGSHMVNVLEGSNEESLRIYVEE